MSKQELTRHEMQLKSLDCCQDQVKLEIEWRVKRSRKRLKSWKKKWRTIKKSFLFLRSLGHYLASSIFDNWDIKPLMFKERSGNISGKHGLKMELKALKKIGELGHEAVLNDITNSINYGDITISTYGFPHVIEIKSSGNRNARV